MPSASPSSWVPGAGTSGSSMGRSAIVARIRRPSGESNVRIVVTVIGCLWAAVVLALVASRLFSPERGGPLALAMVLEPLLLLSLVVFIPLAVFGTSRRADQPTSVWTNTLRALLLVATAVAAVRLGPAWMGPMENGMAASASGNEFALGVTSWNIEADDID